MEIQKTLNSQSNLEKEEWNWRNQPAWLQPLLQSHSHQDSMVLAQRQKYRSMEQNRKPRDKSMHIWTPYLWQRRYIYTMMYSAYKLNKQGDNIQPRCTTFRIWNQSVLPCLVLAVASWPVYRFLKRQIRWSGISISFRIFHSLLWSTQSKALA